MGVWGHLVLALVIVGGANSDNVLLRLGDYPENRLHKCSLQCDKAPKSETNVVVNTDKDFGDRCKRGCRFYMIVRLLDESRILDLNSSLDACRSSCGESYFWPEEAAECHSGCEINSLLNDNTFKVAQLPDIWSVVDFTGDNNGLVIDGGEYHIPFLQGEMPEPDDALVLDPGVSAQLAIVGVPLRIPEVRLRTLPVITSRLKERVTLRSGNGNTGGWFGGCLSVRGGGGGGLPHCLAASLLLLVVLLALWFGLSLEDPSKHSQTQSNQQDADKKVPLDIADEYQEAPLLPDKAPLV